MIMKRDDAYKVGTLCSCKRRNDEVAVKGGLAMTPAQMLEMQEKGIPITTQNMQMSDGEPNPSWNIPLERLRGVDPAELWQQSKTIKEKVKRAHWNDVRKYGS